MPQFDLKCNMVIISTIWVLTDGKAGDEIQCLGVADALAERVGQPGNEGETCHIDRRTIAPRAPWRWLARLGHLDPREVPGRSPGPLAPPFPDLVIASGRKTIPHIRALTRMPGKRPFTVFLKDPLTGPDIADFIWTPDHDAIEGANVLKTLTSPHRITDHALAGARARAHREIDSLSTPRVAVLVGGDSRHHTFGNDDIVRFVAHLRTAVGDGANLMISCSRRTPSALKAAIEDLSDDNAVYFWDGAGDNPYLKMLAHADAVIVTADSVNMVGEATAIGKPVHIFHPQGGHRKITRFLDGLAETGIVTNFTGHLETGSRQSLNSTPVIAEAILSAFRAWHGKQAHQGE